MLRNSLRTTTYSHSHSHSHSPSPSPSGNAKGSIACFKNRSLSFSLCEGNRFQVQFHQWHSHGQRQRQRQRLLVLCRSSSHDEGNDNDNANEWDEHDADYVEGYVVDSELLKHQQLRKCGFSGVENIWHSSELSVPPLTEAKESKTDHISSIEYVFLRHYKEPTIFLRISSDSNLLFPILVGEFAIEKLIDASNEDEKIGGRPNQFQLMKNLVGTLGYEVRMVRITERVVNTYYARIFFGKPGEKAMLSVDARPSDAINLAKRCKVPIYVNKAIVAADAIKLVYKTLHTSGKWRESSTNSSYDLSLDSAPEGPDPITDELILVMNMLIAVVEERYKDAALWRDKLNKLRMSKWEL